MFHAEAAEARLAIELYSIDPSAIDRAGVREVTVREGTVEGLGIDPQAARRAARQPAQSTLHIDSQGDVIALRWNPASQRFIAASVRIEDARAAMNRLYLLLTAALVAVYGLIALTLEVLVLPKQVYRPIQTLLAADDAVQEGRRELEIIPETLLPADELGEIMRSRNQSILKLREQEEALNTALERIECIANELQKKNHLLENARQNLADQDRLASLGMMSAGIAHELNTPLSVLKGCVEELHASSGRSVSSERAALMLRTVRRLERLSDGLLDFARVRQPDARRARVRELAEEAWTLVSLDRAAKSVHLDLQVPHVIEARVDADRIVQVLVNLLRNAVDAMRGEGTIRIEAQQTEREARQWISITITDDGPGIDPAILPTLFEPFRSTKLDARGTGLGLAVSEGIVREHGGLLLARNISPHGAVFEIVIPAADEQTLPTLPGDATPLDDAHAQQNQ